MDEQNPAVVKQVNIPPAVLEEVGNDPRALETWCRKMYLVGADKVHRAMRDPTVPLSQRMLWLDHLAKYGGLGQARNQQVQPGSGFSVNIVLNNTPAVSAAAPAIAQTPAVVIDSSS